jgi:hypothetical protein
VLNSGGAEADGGADDLIVHTSFQLAAVSTEKQVNYQENRGDTDDLGGWRYLPGGKQYTTVGRGTCQVCGDRRLPCFILQGPIQLVKSGAPEKMARPSRPLASSCLRRCSTSTHNS